MSACRHGFTDRTPRSELTPGFSRENKLGLLERARFRLSGKAFEIQIAARPWSQSCRLIGARSAESQGMQAESTGGFGSPVAEKATVILRS